LTQRSLRRLETPCRLLIADDQPHILEALELLLKPEGYSLEIVRTPALVIEALAHESFDGLLIDLNYSRDTTSGQEGLDLISRVKEIDSQIPVVVMTAWGNIELAVEAIRRGAGDFIQKPWENARLLSVLKTQMDLHRSRKRAQWLEAENRILRAQGAPDFIASAPSMRQVLELMARVGPSDANVLITGEHGTGKEVVAQTLHRLSGRADQTIVAVNTGALPEGTFESELFLDEIANVPARQQAMLLRVLETGEIERVGSSKTIKINVRVLSATNADLHAECVAGRFREDLLFRMNTVEIHIPPLRERREDIPVLAAHFLDRYVTRYRRPLKGLEPLALQAMLQHSWPGNVRELDHTIERAVLMARSERIEISDLGLTANRSVGQSLDDMSLEAVEAVLIRKALTRWGGNVSHAADALGISRGALYRRMEKYGL